MVSLCTSVNTSHIDFGVVSSKIYHLAIEASYFIIFPEGCLKKSLALKILCLWISCLLLVGNLCNGPTLSVTKKGGYPCEGHGCGCKSAEDCLRHCCCRSHTLHEDGSYGHGVTGVQVASPPSKYSFLRSLACLGYPHKFSPLPNLVFLPQEGHALPTETPQGFTKEIAFPVLPQGCISPLERPPETPC